ncbi:hypothetical protein AB0D08_17200 [Kitasatospora sp. NPDC048540]|uniref:hypothetical protein n=1 Tax=Kitasatospora sp. NPDC048540 TaxID=3155634 RepID=UPI00340AB243
MAALPPDGPSEMDDALLCSPWHVLAHVYRARPTGRVRGRRERPQPVRDRADRGETADRTPRRHRQS